MKQPDHVLTFVRGEEGELFMHADAKGLSVLISALERLRKKAEEGACEHDHLMTPAWAGSGLSEKKGLESGELIHHLKLYGWTEEWAQKHGFTS
jgi:hypothetical protein